MINYEECYFGKGHVEEYWKIINEYLNVSTFLEIFRKKTRTFALEIYHASRR